MYIGKYYKMYQGLQGTNKMDWVHCNQCFYRPGQQPKKELILTNCGHIFCKCCERSAQIDCCKVCRVKSPSAIPLSSQMPEDARVYFEDPETALERFKNVVIFQKAHRLRLTEFFMALWEKYQKLKLAYHKLDEENKKLRKERDSQRIGFMTPSPSPQFGPESPFMRMQTQENRRPESPFFVTPTRPVPSSQNYRSQNTPSTPLSDSGISPGSMTSQHSYQSTVSRRSENQQRMYRAGLTPPPINRLSLLSVKPEHRSSRY